MLKLHTAADLVHIGFLRSVLESNGIECMLRNEFLFGALGELPATEWPELWLVHDADEAQARRILQDLQQAGDPHTADSD